MTTNSQTIAKNIYVDVEGAHIEISSNTTNQASVSNNSQHNIAEMKSGKFQRLFNRHQRAFYRFN